MKFLISTLQNHINGHASWKNNANSITLFYENFINYFNMKRKKNAFIEKE